LVFELQELLKRLKADKPELMILQRYILYTEKNTFNMPDMHMRRVLINMLFKLLFNRQSPQAPYAAKTLTATGDSGPEPSKDELTVTATSSVVKDSLAAKGNLQTSAPHQQVEVVAENVSDGHDQTAEVPTNQPLPDVGSVQALDPDDEQPGCAPTPQPENDGDDNDDYLTSLMDDLEGIV
jgi:hypothetical protein